MALYFCEVAAYFTREGMNAKEELTLLYLSLRALLLPSLPRELVRYIYELRMLVIAGEAPRIFACIRCEGTEGLHHFYVSESGVVWKIIICFHLFNRIRILSLIDVKFSESKRLCRCRKRTLREMEQFLQMPVNLKLWVKVKKDWRDSDFLLKNFGYKETE